MHGRTLVLCFDGTTNKFDRTNTNVVRLFSVLKKDDHEKQLVYYQAGIGTYAAPGIWNSASRAISRWADSATAWFLPEHVMSGYEFLMQNYRTGDKICLFGFSRGAYTCRALAGFLFKCGLLPKDNHEQIPFAFAMYEQPDLQHAFEFRDAFCRVVEIQFMGVWDTVSSVGLLVPKHLPFAQSTHIIRTFRHALALDERRAKFQPNVWRKEAPNQMQADRDPERASKVQGQSSPRPFRPKELEEQLPLEKTRSRSSERYEKRPPTDVVEVWFAGTHADVGGGSVLDTERFALSSISLRWMIRECAESQSGVLFDNIALKRAGIPPSVFRAPVSPFRGKTKGSSTPTKVPRPNHDELPSAEQILQINSSPKLPPPSPLRLSPPLLPEVDHGLGLKLGSAYQPTVTVVETHTQGHSPDVHAKDDPLKVTAEHLDEFEAGVAMFDQIKKPFWAFMEFVPFIQSYQDVEGNWHKRLRMNLFKSRKIRDPNPRIHVSVMIRQQKLPGYRPAARFRGEPIWVQ